MTADIGLRHDAAFAVYQFTTADNVLPEAREICSDVWRVSVCKESMMTDDPSSQKQAELFTYMSDPEKRKIAFDAWEKEFGPLLADAQEGARHYDELLDYVRQSNNPEIVREFEERFVRLLPTISEQTTIQLLNGLEEALVPKQQVVEADE
jgi:hypothetical protein